ncbi:PQQ-dependent sugar dehydrogenase [Nocardioides bruguierae]|uniref:PQQ-dependent sugar dehydrogenase n=1 Tax=Nocardioides bruguierae TaxID=2945102 RepID=A0A9X2DAS1_9ACTN|nr:PQQ-dependent sugar dehydrogenase [Nocardioides bruguierae]MCM0622481.1 PQQ-dependent sugar dehydrogenase [Nocardioides bruguierae]
MHEQDAVRPRPRCLPRCLPRRPPRAAAAAAGLALTSALLVACGDGASSSRSTASSAEGAGVPSVTVEGSTVAGRVSGPFVVQELGTFAEPWSLAFLPGTDQLLVGERSGSLHLRDQESGEVVEVSGVPEVVDDGQGGLGDVVPGPTFADDAVVYLSWAEAGDGGVGAAVGRATLATYRDGAALEDLEVVWRQTPKVSGTGHFGHRLAFSPNGQELYVSSGERQLQDPAQDTTNTLGTIVRLTLDGDPAPGNPLADEGGVSAEIFTWGHRNPLGLAFAPDGRLWSSEMGPEGGDELNLVEAGGNYGWPEASNGSQYGGEDIPDHTPGDGFVAPVVSWDPSISPGSLMVYDGEMFPDWQGDAFLGALSGEALVRVDLEGADAGDVDVFDLDGQRVRAVAEAPDGAIWLLEDEGSGRLLRLTPA